MVALARSFPALAEAAGTEPWDPPKLVAWLNGKAVCQAHWAGRFLLSVWEPAADWTSFGLRENGRFDFFEALAVWDEAHKTAFQRWVSTR